MPPPTVGNHGDAGSGSRAAEGAQDDPEGVISGLGRLQLCNGHPAAFWPALWGSLRFLGIVLVVIIVLLPVYGILLFFPPLFYILSLAVNGYLVGREYFEAVAWRYLPRPEADRLRRRRRGDVWLCGVLIVLLLTIPVVNFLVPIVATAFMVHVYKRLRATG